MEKKKSAFVVNGQTFESDFEAALFIVLKSEHLTVGSFYDEAVSEQRKLRWKFALLEDQSLVKVESASSESEKSFDSCERSLKRMRVDDSNKVVAWKPTEVTPSGQSILNAVRKMCSAVQDNKVCPYCKEDATEWGHESAILYICYNVECPLCTRPPLQRIVGWSEAED